MWLLLVAVSLEVCKLDFYCIEEGHSVLWEQPNRWSCVGTHPEEPFLGTWRVFVWWPLSYSSHWFLVAQPQPTEAQRRWGLLCLCAVASRPPLMWWGSRSWLIFSMRIPFLWAINKIFILVTWVRIVAILPSTFAALAKGWKSDLFIPNTRILCFLWACLPPLDTVLTSLHQCLLVCLNHPTYGLPAGNLETFISSCMSAGQPCTKASFAIWKSSAASLISLAQLQLLGVGEAHLFSLRKIFSMQVSVLELLWNIEMVHGARGIRL